MKFTAVKFYSDLDIINTLWPAQYVSYWIHFLSSFKSGKTSPITWEIVLYISCDHDGILKMWRQWKYSLFRVQCMADIILFLTVSCIDRCLKFVACMLSLQPLGIFIYLRKMKNSIADVLSFDTLWGMSFLSYCQRYSHFESLTFCEVTFTSIYPFMCAHFSSIFLSGKTLKSKRN